MVNIRTLPDMTDLAWRLAALAKTTNDAQDTSINSLTTDIAAINADITAINADITAINADITAINADITAINADITAINAALAAIGTIVDREAPVVVAGPPTTLTIANVPLNDKCCMIWRGTPESMSLTTAWIRVSAVFTLTSAQVDANELFEISYRY